MKVCSAIITVDNLKKDSDLIEIESTIVTLLLVKLVPRLRMYIAKAER